MNVVPKNYRYLILSESKLTIESIKGDVNLNDFMQFKGHLQVDQKFDPNYNVLVDIRDTKIFFEANELERFIHLMHQNLEAEEGAPKKIAVLTSSPIQVAVASIIQKEASKFPVKIGIFSTIYGSLSWLEITGLDREKAENYLS